METKKVGWLDAADKPSPNVGKIGERGHRERRRTGCISLISLLEWRKSKRKARERQSGTSFVTHSRLTHHFPANRSESSTRPNVVGVLKRSSASLDPSRLPWNCHGDFVPDCSFGI